SPIEVTQFPHSSPLTRRLDVSNATIDLPCNTIKLHLSGNPPTTSRLTWITPYAESGRNTKQRVGEFTVVSSFLKKSFLCMNFLHRSVTLVTAHHPLTTKLAVASTKTNFERYDGVLGIGPRSLTLETLKDDPAATYPTFTTGWLPKRHSSEHCWYFFKPVTKGRYSAVGELAFGEPDDTKCTMTLYTLISLSPRLKELLGIDLTITYRDVVILLPTAGIIATSREFIYIASYAFDWYRVGTGATFDEPTGLLRITPDQYGALGFLKFHIGNIHGAEDKGIYLIIKRLDEREKMGFIIGYTFMQRFYTVGFATTPFTYAVTNW
ncbi:hypothetical protein BDR07DRAFT_1430152, partial [Suillus spraguei]